MAAFYTYRHVELDRVGCGKRKVLKPPGGGSSLFFGGDDDDMAPRRVKNHNSSNLPLGDVVETGDQKVSRADSIDGTNTPSQGSVSNGSPTNSEPTTPRSGTPLLNGPLTYDLPTPIRPLGRRMQAGNPVTGEGYTTEAAVVAAAAAEAKKEETPRKGRVPPGGYSTKLW